MINSSDDFYYVRHARDQFSRAIRLKWCIKVFKRPVQQSDPVEVVYKSIQETSSAE
ncbi:hypothetical protein ACQCVK_01350 [Rossellomorea vietnamensis]|uniref:hypothetical protein n=1 Tax=Rossellomorea vietnamensis TaxID=218284 RepID=UPI001653E1FC|nr:hypothetical protein [Rossellomorea vietnamensis]